MEGQVKEIQSQMDSLKAELNDKFGLIMAKLNEKTTTQPIQPSRHNMEEGNPKPLSFTPKLEFPKFNGDNPNECIRKCSKYFELCKIQEEQKVDFASLYMTDKAATWVASYLALQPLVSWIKFCTAVRARFLDRSLDLAVENFNRLIQEG